MRLVGKRLLTGEREEVFLRILQKDGSVAEFWLGLRAEIKKLR